MRDLVLVWWVFVACLLTEEDRDSSRREEHFCLALLGCLRCFGGGKGGHFRFWPSLMPADLWVDDQRFKFLRDLVNGYALARANGKLALPSMVIKLR